MLTTGSCNGLGRTRFGGFFYASEKHCLREQGFTQPVFHCRSSFAAARSVICARSFNELAARLRASSSTLLGAVSGLPA
jgi:hypothetical protein